MCLMREIAGGGEGAGVLPELFTDASLLQEACHLFATWSFHNLPKKKGHLCHVLGDKVFPMMQVSFKPISNLIAISDV